MYSRDRLLAVEMWKYVQHRQTAENGELPVFDNVNQMQTYIVAGKTADEVLVVNYPLVFRR